MWRVPSAMAEAAFANDAALERAAEAVALDMLEAENVVRHGGTGVAGAHFP